MRWIVGLLAFSSLWAQPSQVILIRHGEKPAEGNSLSLRGRQRAAALVPTFLGMPSLLQYNLPAAIYAARPSEKDPSVRSQQTVMVLAEELDLPLQNRFTLGQTSEVADEILHSEDYEGKMIVICWPHGEIPKLASLLGAKDAPKKWSDDTFDRFWILTFEDNGQVSFKNMPQKLLSGDSSR